MTNHAQASLVILDLDGTLVDNKALIVQILQTAADVSGLSVPSREAIAAIIGLSLDHAFHTLFPDADPAQQASGVQAYRTEALKRRAEGQDPEDLFPGTRAMVAQLRQDGHLLGIATGKARRGVDHFCKRFNMAGWFETVQTPDTNPSKPHPGMIESAVAETGARVDRTVMVGDTSFDMEMARNAGVISIGVAWGNHSVDVLERAGARHIVRAADDLPQVVTHVLEQGARI